MAKVRSRSKADKVASMSPTIQNRRARFDYHITDTLECGIQLRGTEVKSVRTSEVSLAEGFCQIDPARMELWLVNVEIGAWRHAAPRTGHEPKQRRKLLAHKREIEKLHTASLAKGVTLIPLRMYFVGGRVKVEVGVGEGKKAHDKRDSLKARDADRDIRRAMTRKVLH